MKFEDLGVNYLLVNATNQFLLEYIPLEESSCYHLTGFTGSTGDALVCYDDKIKLFVDGRYHEQADIEIDAELVEVVKLKLGEKQDEIISSFIKPNSVFGIVSSKISQTRFEVFSSLLKEKNVTIKLLDFDIYEKKTKSNPKSAEIISKKYTGKNTREKLEQITKPQLITNSEEISYICNLRDFNQDYAVKVDGKLLLLMDRSILFSDTLTDNIPEIDKRPLKEFYNFIKNIKDQIIVDKSLISAHDYSLIQNPLEKSSEIKVLKSIKNNAEIEHLKHCFQMTDNALKDTRKYIYENDNLSEKDIEVTLENNFKKYGAKSLSFKSIVARNQNSALAHYSKSSKTEILKDGDLVLIDCGAYYEGGLATDITRVFVKGEPSELQKRVYTTVLKMFLHGYNYNLTKETTGFDIDNYVREYASINKIDGFKFSHGLGHGIGICVHEMPPNLSIKECAHTVLKNNMCFTIEPGLYNEKLFGIRLENSCYLNQNKIKSFTNMCYEKKLIEYKMLTEQEQKWLNNFEVL